MNLRTIILRVMTSLLLLSLLMVAWQAMQHRPREVATRTLGLLRDYPAWWWQRGVVVLFAGVQGWQADEVAAATALARRGYRVLGVDTGAWLQSRVHETGCWYLPGLIEAVSREQQRLAGTERYQLPWLLGRDEGAALAWMAQLQAPPLSFSGVVALNPQPRLPVRADYCNQTPTGPDAVLPLTPPEADDPIRILISAHGNARTDSSSLTRALKAVPASLVLKLPDAQLWSGFQAAQQALNDQAVRRPLADLPLVELPPSHAHGDVFTILYSGDGGWRDLDQTLADVMAQQGMPVVGLDTLSYYWHEVAPERAAADLARIIQYYQQHWRRKKVLLVGFSFGANVLPFLYPQLPAELQADVVRLVLLAPERKTAFAINPAAWLHLDRSNGKVEIAPQLQFLPNDRLQCIYGEKEQATSLCTDPNRGAMPVVRKRGGHHFDENYPALAAEVMAGLLPVSQPAVGSQSSPPPR